MTKTRFVTQYNDKYSSYYVHWLGPVSIDRHFSCKKCYTYVARIDDLLSKAFVGSNGQRAALFEDVSNVSLGERQSMLMRSGAYTVRELNCLGCETYVGWKIVEARESSEKWKEGAFVLERKLLVIHSVFEGDFDSSQWSPKVPTVQVKLPAISDLKKRKIQPSVDSDTDSVGTVTDKPLPPTPPRPLPPIPTSVTV